MKLSAFYKTFAASKNALKPKPTLRPKDNKSVSRFDEIMKIIRNHYKLPKEAYSGSNIVDRATHDNKPVKAQHNYNPDKKRYSKIPTIKVRFYNGGWHAHASNSQKDTDFSIGHSHSDPKKAVMEALKKYDAISPIAFNRKAG